MFCFNSSCLVLITVVSFPITPFFVDTMKYVTLCPFLDVILLYWLFPLFSLYFNLLHPPSRPCSSHFFTPFISFWPLFDYWANSPTFLTPPFLPFAYPNSICFFWSFLNLSLPFYIYPPLSQLPYFSISFHTWTSSLSFVLYSPVPLHIITFHLLLVPSPRSSITPLFSSLPPPPLSPLSPLTSHPLLPPSLSLSLCPNSAVTAAVFLIRGEESEWAAVRSSLLPHQSALTQWEQISAGTKLICSRSAALA